MMSLVCVHQMGEYAALIGLAHQLVHSDQGTERTKWVDLLRNLLFFFLKIIGQYMYER